MTKREICKRLFDLYNFTFSKVADTSRPDAAELAFKIAGEIRFLLLDLAAPDDHFADAGKMMREEEKKEEPAPAIWSWWDCVFRKNKEAEMGRPCLKEDCRDCNLRPKDTIPVCDVRLNEVKPKAEEKHPGVLAKPGKDGEIEFCWCQKCYAKADVVHDPFGDGENWSYCKTCGVSFRLKRKREEGK